MPRVFTMASLVEDRIYALVAQKRNNETNKIDCSLQQFLEESKKFV